MCSRYWVDESPELRPIVEEMNRSPLVNRWLRTQAVKRSGEIRPTDVAPVIAPDRQGKRAVFPMRWGFTGKTLMINARVETAAEKPTFRESWQRRRCVIPASWYYEWEHRQGNDGKKYVGDRYLLQPRCPVFSGTPGRAGSGIMDPVAVDAGSGTTDPVAVDAGSGTADPVAADAGSGNGDSVTWMCGLYRIEEGLPVFVILTREPGEEIRFIHDRMPLILPEDCIDQWIKPGASPEALLNRAVTDMVYDRA
jgi:putative SOS response-associated peptidase YedK